MRRGTKVPKELAARCACHFVAWAASEGPYIPASKLDVECDQYGVNLAWVQAVEAAALYSCLPAQVALYSFQSSKIGLPYYDIKNTGNGYAAG